MTTSDTLSPFYSIDPAQLPKHFESQQKEKLWNEFWQKSGVYHWDSEVSREKTFVVDTPPPTVSGSLHIGHVFSYTHTDVIARQKRMAGMNIFYPMGWDDNGLPTERRVQNYFHVRSEAGVPYQENLQLEQASAKKRKDRPLVVSRANFIELCHQVTKEDEKAFMNVFQRVGLSVDWRQIYATMDDHCRKTAQASFLDLYNKEKVYSLEAPTMWDVDFQTAVAQAEVEDREKDGAFHDIEFAVEDSDRSFVIATTRPELLPACIGVTAHPDDERYKDLFGKNAITPLFKAPVKIFPSELADPEKGTGILMVCSFGDQTDVQWWKENKLPLRQIIGRNGRLEAVEFGDSNWPSTDPQTANKFYEELVGKNTKQAQKRIVELLQTDESEARSGLGKALKKEPRPIKHSVKFYEKGDRPLEFVSSRQWFVSLLDHKPDLLKKGQSVAWHPEHMFSRFQNWTENLAIDWCISRQRFFGVPFPLWYKLDKEGEILFDEVIVAEGAKLPIDPTTDTPEGYSEAQRDQASGFTAAPDVFDTWFTSSMTPQISSHWVDDKDRHSKLFPADLRPQGHDIIRTWAFYTIAKSLLHEESIPWKHVAISGWILDPDRKKMSKSKGNVVTPLHLLDEYGSDAVRYWSASARLGADTAFDEKVLKVGRRLSTKLYNASKFVLSQKGSPAKITEDLDLAFLSELKKLCESVDKSFSQMNYAQALQETERFFWNHFTDSYLELVKTRARGEGYNEQEQNSAVSCLRFSLQILLKLFAPTMPYITEEVWSWSFAKETGVDSIHGATWPSAKEFDTLETELDYATVRAAFTAIHKYKSENGLSIGAEVSDELHLISQKENLVHIEKVKQDLVACTKAKNIVLQEGEAAQGDLFVVKRAG